MIKDRSNKMATEVRRGWADKVLFIQAAKEVVGSTNTAVTSKLIRKLKLLPRVTRIRTLQLYGSTPRILLARTDSKTSGRLQLIAEVHLPVPRSHNTTSWTFKGQLLMKVLPNYKCPVLKAIKNTVLVRQFQQLNLSSRVHRVALPDAIETRRICALHSEVQHFPPRLHSQWKYLIRNPTCHHRSVPVQAARVCMLGIMLERDEVQRRWK